MILTIILRKSVKLIQLNLNELVTQLPQSIMSVINSAYTQARAKLKHTAFIALNQVIVESVYADDTYRKYLDRRVLAVDGSKIRLPGTEENRAVFGVSKYANQIEGVTGEHTPWLWLQLCTMLCNNICLDALLEPITISEHDLAKRHGSHLRPNDLVIFDRGYCSYGTITVVTVVLEAQADYLIRCSKSGFKAANDMFSGFGSDSIVTTITPSQYAKQRQRERDDQSTARTVRFVRVLLDNGECEVLVTSLLDEVKYPPVFFKELYWIRWGVETFYGTLKTVLALENFTGTSPEAVRQDFFARCFFTDCSQS